jgi:hypothetical protein
MFRAVVQCLRRLLADQLELVRKLAYIQKMCTVLRNVQSSRAVFKEAVGRSVRARIPF